MEEGGGGEWRGEKIQIYKFVVYSFFLFGFWLLVATPTPAVSSCCCPISRVVGSNPMNTAAHGPKIPLLL